MTSREPTSLTVTSSQGGALEVLAGGPEDGLPLLFHSGTPSGAVGFPLLERAAEAQGVRVVTYSRPGYGRSEPRARPGTLADDVADAAAVLDSLGVDTFVTLGWSGGGPRAIACAALLPEQCLAAASLAGAAPRYAEGLDWLAGMGPENVEEFGAAGAGVEALQGWLEENGAPALVVTADDVAASLGELVPPVDKEALTGEFAEFLASSFRAAGLQGVTGWRDDDLLLVQPWGFDLGAITVPTSVWQGEEDLMVPFDHGRWLASHLPGTRVHLEPGEGHISLVARIDRVVAELVELAGGPR